MTEREIREAYKCMSNKNKGVEILADRNGCKPRHVRAILEIPSPKKYKKRTDESGLYPSGWGKYSMIFWKFYNSSETEKRIEFETDDEAIKCAKSIYRCMSDKRIYDVYVKRRRNVLYLEKMEGRK